MPTKYYTPRIQSAMEEAANYASVPEEVMQGDPAELQKKGEYFGRLDKVKYYDRLESNLREIGDTRGVMKVQKERDEHLAGQQKATAEKEKQSLEMGEKKQKAGEEKLRFFGSIAGDIAAKAEKDPEGAQRDHDTSLWIARKNGVISDAEYEEAYGKPINLDEVKLVANHYQKTYGWKEEVGRTKAAKTGSGKGGTPTSFNQIVDKLRRELKISGEPLIKMAREVYSEGKYNRNAAAVSLKKGGMSEEGIRKFLDKLEGKEDPAPAKMKISRDKVKFID